jgi:Xaa-Pro aminopeptidase
LLNRIRRFCALLAAAAWLLTATAPAQPPQSPQSQDAYSARRAALRQKLGNGWLVLFGNSEPVGSEAYRAFRQESNFFYLTGYSEPGGVLLLAPQPTGSGERAQLPEEVFFLPPRNPREEAWTGPQLDPQQPETASRLGFVAVRDAATLDAELRRYARYYRTLYTLLPRAHDSEEEQAVARERVARLQRLLPAADVRDAQKALAGLRQVKSATELQQIRRAVNCTLEAFLAASREIAPGKFEYEIAALMKYTMERMGCTVTGFDPIIGSGPHSVILHYTRADGRVEAGDLVVADVGGEYGDYSADVSRTFPVSGHFTDRQREIYKIVLEAQKAAIAAVKPGATLYGRNGLHEIAYAYLNSHGQDLHGAPLGKYFTHGIGHSVGLDVHDVTEDFSVVLQLGMVLAIEPGLYLPEENIGVRIEDNVLVTKDGYEVLTARLPREPDEVERWMQEGSVP